MRVTTKAECQAPALQRLPHMARQPPGHVGPWLYRLKSPCHSIHRSKLKCTCLSVNTAVLACAHMRRAGKRPPLFLKCLPLGGQLLVHWVAGPAPGTGAGSSSGGGGPRTLELETAAYTTDASSAPDCYRAMPELLSKLRWVVVQCCGWLKRGRFGPDCGEQASPMRGGPVPRQWRTARADRFSRRT